MTSDLIYDEDPKMYELGGGYHIAKKEMRWALCSGMHFCTPYLFSSVVPVRTVIGKELPESDLDDAQYATMPADFLVEQDGLFGILRLLEHGSAMERVCWILPMQYESIQIFDVPQQEVYYLASTQGHYLGFDAFGDFVKKYKAKELESAWLHAKRVQVEQRWEHFVGQAQTKTQSAAQEVSEDPLPNEQEQLERMLEAYLKAGAMLSQTADKGKMPFGPENLQNQFLSGIDKVLHDILPQMPKQAQPHAAAESPVNDESSDLPNE